MTIITPTGISGITSITSTGNTLQFTSASGGNLDVNGLSVTSGTNINVSGVVTATNFVVAAGTTAVPSISPSGDSNTGIFFPSPDTVAIAEGGTEVLRVNSSGFVGIRTNNPGTTLHVLDTGNECLRLDTSVNFNTSINWYNGGTIRWATQSVGDGSNRFRLYSYATNSEAVSVTTSGNIGIGTNNPTTTLDVGGEVTIRRTAPGNEGGQLNLARASDNASAWYLDVYGSTSTPDLRFVDATAAAVRMQIDGSGRVVTPFQPIFQAYGVSGGTFASGNYWIFPSTLVNIGNHYNTSNGIFTAPVAGTYKFWWSFIGNTANDIYRYTLLKNNTSTNFQLRIDTTSTGNEYGDNGSYTIAISLAASDTVRIYFGSDASNGSYPGSNQSTDQFASFGGRLIG